MVEWIKQLFSSAPGVSMSRFLAFILVFNGCGISWYGIIMSRDLNAVAILVGVLIGGGGAIKVGNYKYENKDRVTNSGTADSN